MISSEMRFDDKTSRQTRTERRFVLHSEDTTLENLSFTVDVVQKIAIGARCRLTLRDWRINLAEKRDGKPEVLWTKWNRSMTTASKIISGDSFTFVWSTNGKISELRGLERFRQKLESAAKKQRNTDLANVADNRFNAFYWQNFLQKLAEGTSRQSLKKGSRWQFTRPANFSLLPFAISRTVVNLAHESATVRDVAVLDADTTPRKDQNYRDAAIYAWKFKGSYQNDWKLDWSQNWRLQSNATTQWRGHATIYEASKQGELSLLSDTPTIYREETRVVATCLR